MTAAIAGIGFLILLHEFGHYAAARLAGVAVLEFSLGVGPKLLTKKFCGTAYSLSLVPIGGYVKMLDKEIEEREQPLGKPISAVSPYARIAIAVAGPCANLLFTLFAYLLITTTGIPHQTTLIGTVFQNTPAAAGNIQPGDRILSVGGKPTRYWEDMLAGLASSSGNPTSILVSRKGEGVITKVTPINLNGRWLIGVRASGETTKELTPLSETLPKAFNMTATDAKESLESFTHLFSNKGQIGGPIMIAQIGAERCRMGAASMLMFMAFLSANLFVLNLFPLPVLDGGSIAFSLWEAIFGKPLPAKLQKIIMSTGSVFVLVFITVIILGDIVKMFNH